MLRWMCETTPLLKQIRTPAQSRIAAVHCLLETGCAGARPSAARTTTPETKIGIATAVERLTAPV